MVADRSWTWRRTAAALTVLLAVGGCMVQCGPDPTPVESDPFRACVQERLAKLDVKTTVTTLNGKPATNAGKLSVDQLTVEATVKYEAPTTLDIASCPSRPDKMPTEVAVAMSRPTEVIDPNIQVLPDIWLAPFGGRSDYRVDTSPADHFIARLGPVLVSAKADAPARVDMTVRVGFKLTAALPGQAAVATREHGDARIADPIRAHTFSLPTVAVPNLLVLHPGRQLQGGNGAPLVVLDPNASKGFSTDRQTLRGQLANRVTGPLQGAYDERNPGTKSLLTVLGKLDGVLGNPATTVVAQSRIADLRSVGANDSAESALLVANGFTRVVLYTDTDLRGDSLHVSTGGQWCALVPDLAANEPAPTTDLCGYATRTPPFTPGVSSAPKPTSVASFMHTISSLTFQP